MYQKMKTVDSKIYCSLKDNRLFQVNLVGEGATDYGGPYRDVFHAICEELQSNSLDLFIKSPNNKSEVGSYRDRYIINPSANLEIHSNMYKFLGHLMGNALCTGNMLNLVIHPFIWKLLIESEVKFSDFETIDVMFYKLITDIEKIDCTQQQFDDMYDITFSIQLSNGKEVELLPGGRNLSVSIANKNKFVELAKACRLSEFNKQIANLREGLYKVIPDSIIQYLTSRELEEIICGKPTINLAHLKLKTVYEVLLNF
jgi:E3 ubiquitin-protein ligase HERC2